MVNPIDKATENDFASSQVYGKTHSEDSECIKGPENYISTNTKSRIQLKDFNKKTVGVDNLIVEKEGATLSKLKRKAIKDKSLKLVKNDNNTFNIFSSSVKSFENNSDNALAIISRELLKDVLQGQNAMVSINKENSFSELGHLSDKMLKHMNDKLNDVLMKYFKGPNFKCNNSTKTDNNEELKNTSGEVFGLIDTMKYLTSSMHEGRDTMGDINKANKKYFTEEEFKNISAALDNLIGGLAEIGVSKKDKNSSEIKEVGNQLSKDEVHKSLKNAATAEDRKHFFKFIHFPLLKEVVYKSLLQDMNEIAKLNGIEKDINNPVIHDALLQIYGKNH